MIYNFMLLAMGASGQSSGGQAPNAMGMWLPIILIFAIMYFLIFRPQSKKQKEQKMMIEALKKGDKIITIGGIYGEIVGIREKEGVLIVKISDNTKVELVRSSVAKVISN